MDGRITARWNTGTTNILLLFLCDHRCFSVMLSWTIYLGGRHGSIETAGGAGNFQLQPVVTEYSWLIALNEVATFKVSSVTSGSVEVIFFYLQLLCFVDRDCTVNSSVYPLQEISAERVNKPYGQDLPVSDRRAQSEYLLSVLHPPLPLHLQRRPQPDHPPAGRRVAAIVQSQHTSPVYLPSPVSSIPGRCCVARSAARPGSPG